MCLMNTAKRFYNSSLSADVFNRTKRHYLGKCILMRSRKILLFQFLLRMEGRMNTDFILK